MEDFDKGRRDKVGDTQSPADVSTRPEAWPDTMSGLSNLDRNRLIEPFFPNGFSGWSSSVTCL